MFSYLALAIFIGAALVAVAAMVRLVRAVRRARALLHDDQQVSHTAAAEPVTAHE
ncbi:MAG: hypothetical protein JNM69_42295 [Archangium sp.]|nr:hypothetical protein [Archangium sp.]